MSKQKQIEALYPMRLFFFFPHQFKIIYFPTPLKPWAE